MLTIVERVILLQGVDVFSEVSTQHLSELAAIAREEQHGAGDVLYQESDPSDCMYIVIEGEVRLHRGSIEVTTASTEAAFGTWALFDDELRLTSATVLSEARLLRVDQEDFIELLADNVEITRGVLKAVVQRLRSLAGRLGIRQGG